MNVWTMSGSISLAGTRHSRDGGSSNAVAAADAARQTATAVAILERLRHQPGIVLADEVGMGKTYVALAVVASVLESERETNVARPVVIMVPPLLVSKWRREWDQFSATCARDNAFDWVNAATARSPWEFFKLLDDPTDRRKNLIFLPTNCFNRGLDDGWIKLAFVRAARSQTRMDDVARRSLFRWASSLVRFKSRGLTSELVERLLSSDLKDWKRILVRAGFLNNEDDDPIPELLQSYIAKLDMRAVVNVINSDILPQRSSSSTHARLQDARTEFNKACATVYKEWLQCVDWRAPLLVLDEAHHAKNDGTRLASLFRSADTAALVEGAAPTLQGKFDRLLFLTATPFQLGHHELMRILKSFSAAAWNGPNPPVESREAFQASLTDLSQRLDHNLACGRLLEEHWGALKRSDFSCAESDLEATVLTWWNQLEHAPTDNAQSGLRKALLDSEQSKIDAEAALKKWVIRHNRLTHLPLRVGESKVARRDKRAGAAISLEPGAGLAGLPLIDGTALPFLLAARAQGELAANSSAARAFFAEGLCSSYEAFHHTREGREPTRDEKDDGQEYKQEHHVADRTHAVESIVPVAWYEEQIGALIPSRTAPADRLGQHPKLRAVVDRVVNLWARGEKVLLFCFYRETAKALRDHLKIAVAARIEKLIGEKLGLPPGEDITLHIESIVRRLSEPTGPFHKALSGYLDEILANPRFKLLQDHRPQLHAVLIAYFRSPSFLARHVPLAFGFADGDDHAGPAALIEAIKTVADASQSTAQQRIYQFLDFSKELAERRRSPQEDGLSHELDLYLNAVAVYSQLNPGSSTNDGDEDAGKTGSYRVLPVVRMVFGDTGIDARERLMQAFNSPLLPEILVSSAVLGEGVDLHRFCRYVVHHDLSWNPSTLEQRTGRLDRIRCKAEYSHQPIVIYEPYIGGSADEKMYRVVKDRERWFQVVMGQKFEFNEAASERIAARVPIPKALTARLIFNLHVWSQDEALLN